MDIVNFQITNLMQFTQAAKMLTDDLPPGRPSLADAEVEITDIARERGGLTLRVGADGEKPGGETSLAERMMVWI
jgi:hypothetical protein